MALLVDFRVAPFWVSCEVICFLFVFSFFHSLFRTENPIRIIFFLKYKLLNIFVIIFRSSWPTENYLIETLNNVAMNIVTKCFCFQIIANKVMVLFPKINFVSIIWFFNIKSVNFRSTWVQRNSVQKHKISFNDVHIIKRLKRSQVINFFFFSFKLSRYCVQTHFKNVLVLSIICFYYTLQILYVLLRIVIDKILDSLDLLIKIVRFRTRKVLFLRILQIFCKSSLIPKMPIQSVQPCLLYLPLSEFIRWNNWKFRLQHFFKSLNFLFIHLSKQKYRTYAQICSVIDAT